MSAPSTASQRSAQLALLFTVLAALLLLLVPLPALLLDLLWASLLAFSLAVLVVVLGIERAARLSAFPALLLLTTVVRMTLCLATTRAIVTNGEAGALVQGLGALLLAGSPWVGWALLFGLVITQWAVLVRGNERIAEVRARFALEALPGRQLSIDADLRSGTLQAGEAQRQRRQLSDEGELYGALDGAMKFARGEQLVLLVLVLVAAGGGMANAVFESGLPLGDAFRRFSLLAIGVGVIAEVSAFAFATAAGLLLTRSGLAAADLEGGTSLGGQLLQLLRGSPGPSAGGSSAVRTWSLHLAGNLAHARAAIEQAAQRLRAQLSHRLGVAMPACTVVLDRALPAGHCVLALRDIPVQELDLTEALDANAIAARCEHEISPLLTRHAAAFLGIAETQALLDGLDANVRATAQHVVPKLISVPALCEVLRRLVAEGVIIRDLIPILEALAITATDEKDPAVLAEKIRPHLKRSLSHHYTGGSNELSVLLMDPDLEDLLRGSVTTATGGRSFGLSAGATRDLVQATRRALQQGSAGGASPALIAAADLRPLLHDLLQHDLPGLPVLSPNDLLPQIMLKPLATLSVRDL